MEILKEIKKSTRQAYGEVLLELGKEKDNLFVMDADLSVSTKTCYFAKSFPKRFYNAGVAEQNMIGIASGLSKTGKTVIASTLAVFAPGRVFDQVRNTLVHSNCDVKIVATHGGISVGKDGSSHQSIEDIALARVIPGMRVIVPCDAVETKKVIKKIVDIPGPFYVRLGRADVPVITSEETEFEIGKGYVLKEGKDVTLIGCGMTVFEILGAADILASENIDAEVINMSSIKPIDGDLIIESANKTKKIFTCEEHSIIGGLGSAVLETLEEKIDVFVKRIGIQDCFGESGLPEELFEKYGLSATKITEKVKKYIDWV
ncbi:MAG: transketolase family protein [Actinobacteria bacterium]|nr:transketolase family protein [Actinomycetota bacterium]